MKLEQACKERLLMIIDHSQCYSKAFVQCDQEKAERRTGTPTVQDLSESDTRETVRNYDYESCCYICEVISCTELVSGPPL